jgi:hypothetical protein
MDHTVRPGVRCRDVNFRSDHHRPLHAASGTVFVPVLHLFGFDCIEIQPIRVHEMSATMTRGIGGDVVRYTTAAMNITRGPNLIPLNASVSCTDLSGMYQITCIRGSFLYAAYILVYNWTSRSGDSSCATIRRISNLLSGYYYRSPSPAATKFLQALSWVFLKQVD